MKHQYPLITRCLQGLKGLTENEAEAFFIICSKKSVSVKDIQEIFVEIKTKMSRSKAYTTVSKFENAKLIFSVNNSNKKEYKAIHPRAILDELKVSLKNIEKEITELEASYETSDFEEEDPRDTSKTLRSENEITTICNVLHKDCEITIIHNNDEIINRYVNILSHCGKTTKGNINAIIFKSNSKMNKCGIIHISKRREQGGKPRIFGQILYDKEKYEYIYNNEIGVKKNG